MKSYTAFSKHEFNTSSSGKSYFNYLLEKANIKKECYGRVEEIEIAFDVVNVWNDEGDEILDEVKDNETTILKPKST